MRWGPFRSKVPLAFLVSLPLIALTLPTSADASMKTYSGTIAAAVEAACAHTRCEGR